MTSIIVGIDLSDNALTAAKWAVGLAQLVEGSQVRFVQVFTNDEFELRQTISDNDAKREVEDSRRAIEAWLGDIDTDGIEYDIDIYVGRRTDKIREAVEKWNARWLVLGKSGRGRLSKFFVGSTAERLAFDPPCPVVLVHPDTDQWKEPLNVVSAVDLGESSSRAAALAGDLVRRHGGDFQLVHIISLPQGSPPIVTGPTSLPETLTAYLDETRSWAHRELKTLIAQYDLPVEEVADVEIRPGYPIAEILDATESAQANLLTIGSHGRSRVVEFIMGDVGRSLVKRAPSTILITPAVDAADE